MPQRTLPFWEISFWAYTAIQIFASDASPTCKRLHHILTPQSLTAEIALSRIVLCCLLILALPSLTNGIKQTQEWNC